MTTNIISTNETLAKLRPLLPLVGISRVANVTGLDCLNIFVALSIRPNAKHLSVSQGKGLSWEQAQISAIMEAMEGYHAENPIPATLMGNYEILAKNNNLLDPRLLPEGIISADLTKFSLSWASATELLSNQKIYIPHAFICLDSTNPTIDQALFKITSAGLAAGNSIEEAICHGLLELIERDAVTRWRSSSTTKRINTRVKLASIDSPISKEILTHFMASNIQINVWEVPNACNIPTYYCGLIDTQHHKILNAFGGSGSHFSRDTALARALLEAAQSRLTYISGSRDDLFPHLYNTKQNNRFLTKKVNTQEHVDFHEARNIFMPENFSDRIAYLKKCISHAGFSKIIVVDHTKPELNVPVIHAIVPGMLT